MPESARKIPIHELTYERLRDMVLFGELEPGQPVTIQGLIVDLGAGMTPVREAIRRLCSQGALELQGNRRICVPKLTLEALDQLAFARLKIEPQLALMACTRLNDTSMISLQEIDQRLDQAIALDDVQGYLMQNISFILHFTVPRPPLFCSTWHSRFGFALAPRCGWSVGVMGAAACQTAITMCYVQHARAIPPSWPKRTAQISYKG